MTEARDNRVHLGEDENGNPVFKEGPSQEEKPPEALASVADFLLRIEKQLFIDPKTAAEGYLKELWEAVPGQPFPRDEVMTAIALLKQAAEPIEEAAPPKIESEVAAKKPLSHGALAWQRAKRNYRGR